MKNCFKKRKLLGCAGALLATLLMLGGCASADMPPLPEQPGETEQQAPDNIGTLYEQSNVVMTGGRNLVNLPGIVLYTSQEDVGMHLSYANKLTGKAGIVYQHLDGDMIWPEELEGDLSCVIIPYYATNESDIYWNSDKHKTNPFTNPQKKQLIDKYGEVV